MPLLQSRLDKCKRTKESFRATAFGEPLKSSDLNPKSESAFYTGKSYDSELGAYVYAYRNYRADLGRWTTTDPAGYPDGTNNYRYAATPNNSFDRWGLALATGNLTEKWELNLIHEISGIAVNAAAHLVATQGGISVDDVLLYGPRYKNALSKYYAEDYTKWKNESHEKYPGHNVYGSMTSNLSVSYMDEHHFLFETYRGSDIQFDSLPPILQATDLKLNGCVKGVVLRELRFKGE